MVKIAPLRPIINDTELSISSEINSGCSEVQTLWRPVWTTRNTWRYKHSLLPSQLVPLVEPGLWSLYEHKGENHQVLHNLQPPWNKGFHHAPLPSTNSILRLVLLVTILEVGMAISKIKNGKAPGPDDIPSEVWKMLGCSGAKIFTGLFNCAEVSKYTNSYPVCLLCYSIFQHVLESCLVSVSWLCQNQCVFVQGSGTTVSHRPIVCGKAPREEKWINMVFLDFWSFWKHPTLSHPDITVSPKPMYVGSNMCMSAVRKSCLYLSALCYMCSLLFIQCMVTITASM